MTVYVDNAENPFGRMKMCHLWADTEAELLAMVDAIGVARRWIQRPPKASWLHFDIAMSKRVLALRLGAVLTDRYGPLEHTAKLDIASGDPARIERGECKLAAVAGARARRTTNPELFDHA